MFDHEKLKVYQSSINFFGYASSMLENHPKRISVCDQLDRASTSISLNIAEGNGKFSSKDRCRYLDIARGSAMECAACLDIMLKKGMIEEHSAREGKAMLKEIVSMLIGLIKSQSEGRLFEDVGVYGEQE